MAKQKIEVGDRLTIGVDVTAVWPDGKVTIHIPNAGQKVTLPNDSDVEEVSKGEKPSRPRTSGIESGGKDGTGTDLRISGRRCHGAIT